LSNYVKLISAEPQVIDELQKELLAVKKVGSIRDNLAQRHIIDLSDLTDIPQKAPLNDSW
jgi:purine nucleoside phosphorylase